MVYADKGRKTLVQRAQIIFFLFVLIAAFYIYKFGFTLDNDPPIQLTIFSVLIGLGAAVVYSYRLLNFPQKKR